MTSWAEHDTVKNLHPLSLWLSTSSVCMCGISTSRWTM